VIYDVFPFFNELELLDIRLHVHGPYVDRFVLIEGDRTHSGNPKPFHYWENRHLFEPFNNRISHVGLRYNQAQSPPWPGSYFGSSSPFVNEGIQREHGLQAMPDYKDDDLILLSDADEITDFTKLDLKPGINRLCHNLFYYYLNVWCGAWPIPKVCKGSEFRKLGGSFHKLRFCSAESDVPGHGPLPRCGWHFSFLGGLERIRAKLEAYAEHSDYNKPDIMNAQNMANRINNLQDILCRKDGLEFLKKIEVNEENHPKYIVENKTKFEHLILQ
jgi:beta-1,4-mannosyl-glycoprotein beta-1,4-N-acetylglucosaminyltransferase